jgi:hypothetical protein
MQTPEKAMQRLAPNFQAPTHGARTLAAAFLIAAGIATYGQARAQAPVATLPSTGTIAVPTYESVGLYWQSPGGSAGCEVKYRKSGETAWAQGLALWYDARDGQCRGSLVSLAANTWYQVELNLPGQAATRGLVFKTWSNTLPVKKTIAVTAGSGTFNVAEGGSASEGYVVYEGNGATLDAQNGAQYNVSINASYVIVRNLVLKGAKQDAIRISPSVKDVVIEDNDISGWGRTRDGTWGADMDSGIRAVCTTPSLERVTVQRNRIHDPRYSANSWSDGHPAGPQAITFSYCGGNHVFRHNEAYSTNGNYFNDVFGGEDNFTKAGFPNADSDIYGNRLSNAWDDGIESEGANENVRIWGNYIDKTATGIASTVDSVGPMYIFRNVYNRSQMYAKVASLDQDDRQVFFKSGSDASLGDGRRYIFHNTMLQAVQSGLQYPLGAGAGVGGTGSSQLINNTWSKNNIYEMWKPKGAMYQVGVNNDFSNDMYNGNAGEAKEVNGIVGTPVYAAGAGWSSEAGGNYQLASTSPGFGKGVRIANFNDGAAAPDIGAHQSGTGAMKFGIAASAGSAISGSPIAAPATPTLPAPAPPAPPSAPISTPTTPVLPIAPVAPNAGVTLGTASLNFNGSAARTQTVTFTNGSTAKVTFIQASMTTAKFGQANNCGDVAPGASCTATVTFYPTNSGNADGTLTLTSTVAAPPAGSATSGGGVTVSSASLAFAGEGTQTVTFTNNTAAKVTFIQAAISSARFGQSNNCGDVAPGASCSASVTYYPSNSGADTATFTMTSTASGGPAVISLSKAGATSAAAPSTSLAISRSGNAVPALLTTRTRTALAQ